MRKYSQTVTDTPAQPDTTSFKSNLFSAVTISSFLFYFISGKKKGEDIRSKNKGEYLTRFPEMKTAIFKTLLVKHKYHRGGIFTRVRLVKNSERKVSPRTASAMSPSAHGWSPSTGAKLTQKGQGAWISSQSSQQNYVVLIILTNAHQLSPHNFDHYWFCRKLTKSLRREGSVVQYTTTYTCKGFQLHHKVFFPIAVTGNTVAIALDKCSKELLTPQYRHTIKCIHLENKLSVQ